MQYSLRAFSFIVVTAALLAGCQQPVHKPQPPVATQLDQLSSLLASAQFLRQHCSRTDIPQNDQLQRTALQVAQQRGWNSEAVEYQQLAMKTQGRYQALEQDSSPLSQKCATLNSSSARFIATAQAGRG